MVDAALSLICHRGGPHADVLPLCLRCSSVYAGLLVGAAYELSLRLWLQRRPCRPALGLSVAGLLLMAVVGLAGLYGLWAAPEAVKVFSGLGFGWAIAFLAVATIDHELAWPTVAAEPLAARLAGLLALAGWAALIARESTLGLLGLLAWAGVWAAFGLANFALGLVLARSLGRRAWRLLAAVPLAFLLIGVEFFLFTLWRQP